VYNAHAPVPVEQKLFRAVRVAEDLDAAFELLALLSKDNMRNNRIQELWRAFLSTARCTPPWMSSLTPESLLGTWSPSSPSACPAFPGPMSARAWSVLGWPLTSRPQAFP